MTELEKGKRSRSTELSGGEGFTYEDTVVAYYLTALLHEEGAAGISGRISRVAVQQASQGEPLDDLVVDADLFGEPRRLSLQVKRQLTISAAESNTDFRELIANSLSTRAKPGFRVGVDRYGFIARTVGDERLNSLQRIISWAQASPTGAEFAARFSAGEASQADIDIRDELQTLIQAQNSNEEADFYRHFVAQRMDGLDVGRRPLHRYGNRLGQLTAAGPQDGPVLADTLCRRVRLGEGAGKVWIRPTLLAELRPIIPLKVAPSYASDIATLSELAKSYTLDIRQDIGGIAIDRGGFVDAAKDAAAVFKLSNISGLPGCGKSVVLRHLIEHAMSAGPVLFLKSDRLDGSSWPAFATSIGLQHRLPMELLAEIGATGTPVLFIDGIDRIKPEHRGVVTDLLNVIEGNPSLAHWHVVASSRDQGLEAFRQWVPASFYKTTGIGDVPVELLNDEEAERLATEKPHLRRLLFGTPAVQEIARRPFFAAVLADQFAGEDADDDAPPQTENELITAWWCAGGYNATTDTVLSRQRAIIELAEAGATSLGKAIPARRLAAATISQVGELKRDRIIEVVEEGSVFSFAHDIFFEWAFFRLLIDQGSAWCGAIVAAGEPPLLARVVGLLSQHVFEANGSWAAAFQLLSEPQLRPQWRRAWLLGPPGSPKFLDHLQAFESLVFANGAALLVKFLVWFQAERTIPNPMFLKNPNATLDGAALIRAADRWGWPSDFAVWQRVLSWILARERAFPAVAIPHAVELFSVFQNMLGDIANPMSKRLIVAAEAWLIELEKPRAIINGRSTEPTRWNGLPDRAYKQLVGALRQLILRSGRAYPDAARRVVERAIAMDRRSQDLFESIVAFSPILAQVCPDQLADLIRVEVFKELPRDQMEKERRQRESHYRQLAEIRAKPEQDRTDIERRILSGLFHIHGEKSYDFNDVGVDHHYGSFFPPTPLHQPFASLFDLAPEIARQLVRDIGNRATTGWRQIHEINAPHYGTPLPLDIEFPWGMQRFWGDMRTYAWFLGEGGAQPLEAAFLALTYWAHKRLDAGDDADEVIRAVIDGHENWTVLGLAASLALESNRISETVLPLVTAQRLWHADIARQVQNPGRPITVFGMNPARPHDGGSAGRL